MEASLTVTARLKYFYGEAVVGNSALEYLASDLTAISGKYPSICKSIWISDITSKFLMSNSTVRVIALTEDKRLIIGKISNGNIVIDKLECGITEDTLLLAQAKIVIII